ncbi:MAG: transposase family protein [Alphaproteobacteria bacterium]|nr:transposase family protein [Alphaproteobacteria bacterium]
MRINTKDETLKKNYIQKYQFLITEYEAVKAKSHPAYKRAKDFYKAHNTCAQTFLKYYARYKASGNDIASFVPGKRGPKYKTRRPSQEIEHLVLQLREKGCNKYEINDILRPKLKECTPSPSGVYNILRRHGKNRLEEPMKEEKRKIIKEKAGELAHIDCHHLSKDTIMNDNKHYYLVCVIDSCTRIAWAEVMTDVKALTVMFATLHCFNYITRYFDIRFAEVLTDNGPEFGTQQSKNKEQHPFERLLIEMGITHRYTRAYRPQTNGKVERFWRTLNEDLIQVTHFDSIEHFKKELEEYLAYYNKLRPHQALNGKTPHMVVQLCQRIT